MREEEFSALDPLLMDAYGNQRSFKPRLRRLLAIEPDGWLVADEEGSLVYSQANFALG